jgi:hypothetical protein
VPSKKDGHPPPGEVAHIVPGKDLRRLVNSGANLLVRGEKSAAAATVVALTADFPPPLLTWNAESENGLPAVDFGTLVIHDVDGLDLMKQRVLLTWLEHRTTRVRVITTATHDLFPLVQAGIFLDQLYYRLNTIVIDAVGGDGQAALRFAIATGLPGPRRS